MCVCVCVCVCMQKMLVCFEISLHYHCRHSLLIKMQGHLNLSGHGLFQRVLSLCLPGRTGICSLQLHVD